MLAQDLEIYKAADDLLTLALKVQAQVPRPYRIALGQTLATECSSILIVVARANKASGEARVQHISHLQERLEAATVLFRQAHKLKTISKGVWAASIEFTDSIGKQAQGWLNATSSIASKTRAGHPARASAAPAS